MTNDEAQTALDRWLSERYGSGIEAAADEGHQTREFRNRLPVTCAGAASRCTPLPAGQTTRGIDTRIGEEVVELIGEEMDQIEQWADSNRRRAYVSSTF